MPIWIASLASGFASGIGHTLALASAKVISYIPDKHQSDRDKIYVESHKLSEMAVSSNFNADDYVKHASRLRDTIRSAANTSGQ